MTGRVSNLTWLSSERLVDLTIRSPWQMKLSPAIIVSQQESSQGYKMSQIKQTRHEYRFAPSNISYKYNLKHSDGVNTHKRTFDKI